MILAMGEVGMNLAEKMNIITITTLSVCVVVMSLNLMMIY
ncbi:hypothetical protein UF75_2277 [Desulfosporosinus sp. I2]|nr:hypothetical protein UF75_2277 [Desulfosporosinus sp. I2]